MYLSIWYLFRIHYIIYLFMINVDMNLRAEEFAADEAHGRRTGFIALAVGAGEERRCVDQFAVIGR